MNRDYIEGFMDGHAEGMAAGFNLMEKSKPVPSKTEPREFWIVPSREKSVWQLYGFDSFEKAADFTNKDSR